jgi:hypothetical protein
MATPPAGFLLRQYPVEVDAIHAAQVAVHPVTEDGVGEEDRMKAE